MPPMSLCSSPRRGLVRLLAAVGLVLFSATSFPAVADEHDDEPAVELSIRPVGQPGAYFDLTMEPGESRRLEVTLGNTGAEAMNAYTYPADVHTLVNGGFGATERDNETTGPTTWLEYTADVLELPGGQQSARSFSVTVPEDTKPGEYATSLVLENDEPIEGTGDVALNQIVRQALPVTVRIPGPLEPAFAFGDASHRSSSERSTISVEIANTGNARLKPEGDLTVRNDSGEVVSEASVSMDTFFADTETQVETVLDGTLNPGDYTLTVSMTDSESKVSSSAENIPFTVERSDGGTTGDNQQSLPQILQDSGGGLLLYVAIAGVLVLMVIAYLLIRNQRRKNEDPTA